MSGSAPARKRIAWFVAAAGAFAALDYAFGPDGAEDVVVSAVVKGAKGQSDGEAASATPAPPSRAVSTGGVEAALARLGTWQGRGVAAAGVVAGDAEDDEVAPGHDPFAAVTWAASAPVVARTLAAAPVPPAPAAVPPFPYAYVGRLVDEGVRTLFFAKGDRVLPVKVGDLVDTTYRIDEVDDRQMTFTYVPMQQSAVVALRSP